MIAPRHDPPIITGLSASVVARSAFPHTRWFRGLGAWYYHGPRGRDVGRVLPPRDELYRQIDPALRPLCRLLHARGLGTTPSCAGHFHPRSHFEALWPVLVHEAAMIRGPGLIVHDAETDQPYRFRDREYRLPWRDGNAFCDDVMAQQREGYLGVRVPAGGERFVEDVTAIDDDDAVRVGCARSTPDDAHLLTIRVEAGDPAAQSAAWARLTQHIAALLRAAAPSVDEAR